MKSQPLEETTNATAGNPKPAGPAPVEEEQVAAFLSSHPEFFLRHPDLTAQLRLPHGPSGTVSLVEHQVAALRAQLETERRRLSHLIARAREYEKLSGRLHLLVLQLVTAPDLPRIERVLRESLCKEFDAEAVSLKLFPVAPGDETADPLVSAFLDFVDREHALCGPLEKERADVLFGEDSGKIRSAALIPVRGEVRAGVLAIGSADAERFGPDMGTDHLDRLGEVLSRRLGVMKQTDG